MSFSQLISKLSKPNIAAITAGVTFSTIFLVGNATISGFGVLPYVTSTNKLWPASEKLAAWKYNYDHGKVCIPYSPYLSLTFCVQKYFGGSAVLGALSYTAAATLSPRALKTPLWVAAACSCGVVFWTLGIMKNTNKALIDLQRSTDITDADVHQSDVNNLVSTWKNMNKVRIGLVTVAYGAGMASLLLAV
jgi:hypothetical protein